MFSRSSEAFRRCLAEWVESAPVRNIIIALILINSVTLGMETSPTLMGHYGVWLVTIDKVILGIFVLELLIKIYALGWRFFRSSWNVFDLTIITIALIPASGPLSVLRALRILRLLRLISFIPRLRFVVSALLHSIPGISAIVGLVLMLFYIAAVISTKLFGASFPEWFGNLGASMYTLFQIMTLESWSMGIVRPVMEVYPYAWIFFISFILIATFTMMNLFVAIIVDTMQSLHEREQPDQLVQDNQLLRQELQELREEMRGLSELLTHRTA